MKRCDAPMMVLRYVTTDPHSQKLSRGQESKHMLRHSDTQQTVKILNEEELVKKYVII